MFSLWNKLLREYYPHHENVIDFQGLILVIAIAKCQRAKILTIRERRWICLEMSWNTVIDEKKYWTSFDCVENSANLKQGAQIHQPTAGPVPRACAQSYHTAVSDMDSCFALIGVYQRGKAVGLMNGVNPRLKNPLLPRWVQSSLSSASSTQHMWELLAGNRTAVLPRHARGRWITSYQ